MPIPLQGTPTESAIFTNMETRLAAMETDLFPVHVMGGAQVFCAAGIECSGHKEI